MIHLQEVLYDGVAARLPRITAEAMTNRVRSALSFSLPWLETTIEVQGSVGAVTSDEYNVEGLVAAADAAIVRGQAT